MDRNSHHIVTSFDEELASIRDKVVRMGAIAEAQLASATDALIKRDPELADQVVESDQQIDDLEIELNDEAIHLLALRQPMANDLRTVVAALKIASDLERIGDHAANVAKRSKFLSDQPPIKETGQIRQLAHQVQDQIKSVLDAIVSSDEQKAIEVWHGDKTVDDCYAGLFRAVLDSMIAEGRDIAASTHLLFIAKNIERIGDYATNIAEVLYYQVKGVQIEGGRPKGRLFDLHPPHEQEIGTGQPQE